MKSKLFSAGLFCVLFCNVSFAQFGKPYYHQRSYSSYGEKGRTWLKRSYISASLPFMNLEMDSHLTLNRSAAQTYNTPGPSVDTSIFLNKNCKGSYGFSGGSFFPLARMNDHQMIALDVSMGGYLYNFDFGPVKYSSVDLVTDKAEFYLFDLPVAFVYKSGGEVGLNPDLPVLFSIGAGFAPTFTLGGYNSAAGALFKTRTFLMAELGYYFGLAAKLRFTYYPGTIVMINDTEGGLTLPNNYGAFTVNAFGTGSFLLTLVVLDNSMHWGDDY